MCQEANKLLLTVAFLDSLVTLSKDTYNRAIFLSLAVHLREANKTSLLLILNLYLMLNIVNIFFSF